MTYLVNFKDQGPMFIENVETVVCNQGLIFLKDKEDKLLSIINQSEIVDIIRH